MDYARIAARLMLWALSYGVAYFARGSQVGD